MQSSFLTKVTVPREKGRPPLLSSPLPPPLAQRSWEPLLSPGAPALPPRRLGFCLQDLGQWPVNFVAAAELLFIKGALGIGRLPNH